MYDDVDDFVVSGSGDSDASFSYKKSKKKGPSKSYRDDSWDSDATSDDSYHRTKISKSAAKKRKSNSSHKMSKSKKIRKTKRYSDDSDVEFEKSRSEKTKEEEASEEDEPLISSGRRTRGRKTNYNVILEDSSESENEKAKGAGKQIKNCIDSTEEEYDAKEDDKSDESEESEEGSDSSESENSSKEKSAEDDAGEINDQLCNDTSIINMERTLT